VDEIGLSLRAGTKCGTCLPELRSIVNHDRHAHAAADAH
jgi:NAD(P)H-nitrite reductase large subunit